MERFLLDSILIVEFKDYLNQLHCIPWFRVVCHAMSSNVNELLGDVWWGLASVWIVW